MESAEKWIMAGDEKFYYNEVILYHGRKLLNPEIGRENLEIFYNIVEESGIRYGLILGTLLGAIREKGFIPYVEDTDVFVLWEDREKFLSLLKKFRQHGLELVRVDSDMLSLMRKDEYIDVLFFKQRYKFGLKRIRVTCNDFECSADYLENPVRIMFLGLNIPIPNNPEELLQKTYGETWRIPIPNFPAPSNTFYKKLSSVASKMKKLPFYPPLVRIIKTILLRLGL